MLKMHTIRCELGSRAHLRFLGLTSFFNFLTNHLLLALFAFFDLTRTSRAWTGGLRGRPLDFALIFFVALKNWVLDFFLPALNKADSLLTRPLHGSLLQRSDVARATRFRGFFWHNTERVWGVLHPLHNSTIHNSSDLLRFLQMFESWFVSKLSQRPGTVFLARRTLICWTWLDFLNLGARYRPWVSSLALHLIDSEVGGLLEFRKTVPWLLFLRVRFRLRQMVEEAAWEVKSSDLPRLSVFLQ